MSTRPARADQVTTADVMAVVLPIWTSKHETAQRVRWRISAPVPRRHAPHRGPGMSQFAAH